MHPVKFLQQTIQLGIAPGAINIMRGQCTCASAFFKAGFIIYDASTLASNSWVWLCSQRKLSCVIEQQRISKMNKKKYLYVQNNTIEQPTNPLNDRIESQSINFDWWWHHPSICSKSPEDIVGMFVGVFKLHWKIVLKT